MLLRLFEHWQLSPNQQLSLLGLPTDTTLDLQKYLYGRSLTKDLDKLERSSILLGIHKSLRLLFPRNRSLAYQWMQIPNRAFEGQTPVETIECYGMLGMYLVQGYLDQQLGRGEFALKNLIKVNQRTSLALGEEEVELTSVATPPRESENYKLEGGTEGVFQLIEVWMATVRAFASEDIARQWIATYVPALGCKPINLLTTKQGRVKIMGALDRIEQGDFGG